MVSNREPQAGFSLIEMMVALAVFALAAMALIRLEGAIIRSASSLDATMMAQIVARNVAVETLTDAQPPVTGISNGVEDNGGRSWNWQRIAAPLGDQGAVRVDVTVSDTSGTALGRLTVVRPPNRPVAVRTAPVPGGLQP